MTGPHEGTRATAWKLEYEMVGELILGRFRIERAIGSGGFGTVYRAWDERLHRPVAVKVIDGSDAAPRVVREAQAVARLAHRNIATLYELSGDGDRAFLVSELIEGDTLRALGRRGELNDNLVAEIGADAAAGLAHAHRSGVVHRDVKPENMLVSMGGEAKLVDFGIARVAGERTLTGTGDVLGTLAYMAPEQADGQRPGPAADVYSLALTLYECFCGEHPLIRENAAATARAIGEEVAPLADVRPDLPAPLTDAIDASLDADPELRPLASELEGALAAHASELETDALPAVLRPLEHDGPHALRLPGGHGLARLAPGPRGRFAHLRRPARRRRLAGPGAAGGSARGGAGARAAQGRSHGRGDRARRLARDRRRPARRGAARVGAGRPARFRPSGRRRRGRAARPRAAPRRGGDRRGLSRLRGARPRARARAYCWVRSATSGSRPGSSARGRTCCSAPRRRRPTAGPLRSGRPSAT